MLNEHCRESPFFLMFGRDPVLPLNSLLAPSYRYMGNDANLLSLEALKNMYQIAAENLERARLQKIPTSHAHLSKTLQEGDMVLVKSHTAGLFDPKYVSPSWVVAIRGNQVKQAPTTGGKSRTEHRNFVKYILPADKIISEIPNYERFGRRSKLRLTPSVIPDLKWEWMEDLHLDGIRLMSTVKHLQVSKEMTVREVDVHTIYVGSYISMGRVPSPITVTPSYTTITSHQPGICLAKQMWHTYEGCPKDLLAPSVVLEAELMMAGDHTPVSLTAYRSALVEGTLPNTLQ